MNNARTRIMCLASAFFTLFCLDAAALSFSQYSDAFFADGLSANPASPTEISTTLPIGPGPLPDPPMEISDIDIIVNALTGQFANLYLEFASDPGTIYQLPDTDPSSDSSVIVVFYNPLHRSPTDYGPGITLYQLQGPLLNELDDGTLDVSLYVDGTPGGAPIDYRFVADAFVRPAPEPGSAVLLGGLTLLAGVRRRRRA